MACISTVNLNLPCSLCFRKLMEDVHGSVWLFRVSREHGRHAAPSRSKKTRERRRPRSTYVVIRRQARGWGCEDCLIKNDTYRKHSPFFSARASIRDGKWCGSDGGKPSFEKRSKRGGRQSRRGGREESMSTAHVPQVTGYLLWKLNNITKKKPLTERMRIFGILTRV